VRDAGAVADSWRLLLGVGDGWADRGPAERRPGPGGAPVTAPSAAPAPAPGDLNMAVDAALLESVGGGGPPVLRLYRWSPACLSFGRNQPARGLYDVELAARRGISFVRRPTGGQAVLHDQELTYAVVAPVALVGRPRAAYRTINEALVAGLARLGLKASVAGSGVPGSQSPTGSSPAGQSSTGPVPHDWTRACFRTPESGEVVVGGRKLVGSAQRTEGRVILQHGSLLVGGSQAAAEELLMGGGGGAPGPGHGWTTLASELGRLPDLADLSVALVAGFSEVMGISLAPDSLVPAEAAAVERFQGQFASDTWTWRL
jgi:lipoyl(octanoyl) transferase